MPDTHYNLVVEPDEEDLRLDQFLAVMVVAKSRSYLQKLIKQNNILVNGRSAKPAYKVRVDDRIEITIPEPQPLDLKPENNPLDIIYEDEHLLVINKSPGIIVHPSLNNLNNTLVNALLYHCGESLSGIGGVLRPGIVHRIDKDTSGCLVVAKDDVSHNGLADQFHERKIYKEYLAIVSGWMKHLRGKLELSIGRHPAHRKRMAVRFDKGKEAITEYKVLKRLEETTFINLKMGTGRTHQIRVHMSYIGHPLLGDKEYGRRRKVRLLGIQIKRHMLHAYKLGFMHPVRKKWMEFTAPIPKDMEDLLDMLQKKG